MRRRILLGTLLWLCVLPAGAQYTRPGTTRSADRIPPKIVFDEAIDDARWQFGNLRVAPWLGLRDASFVIDRSDLTDEDEEDFTATVGAGARAYLRGGPKVIFALQALPEYVWWQDDEDKRSFNGRYGGGIFAYFNRLTLEGSYRQEREQRFFTPEVQELTTLEESTFRLALDLELSNRFFFYALGSQNEFLGEADDSPLFTALDRQEDTVEVGLRYEAPSGLSLLVGYEDTETEFANGARSLSNSGSAELFELGYDSERFAASLRLAFRELEPDSNSLFPGFDEATADLGALARFGSRFTLVGYGRRQLVYSIQADSAYALGERLGSRFEIAARQGYLALIAETGEDDYEPLPGIDTRRVDDVTELGVELGFAPRKLFRLSLRLSQTDYDSTLPEFDREVITFGAGLELLRLKEKLQLGGRDSLW